MPRRALLPLTLLALAAGPALARADVPLAPAPGGVNLSAGAGWAAWAEPQEDTGWQLVVRAPDGTVSRPAVPGFAGPPEVSVGAGHGRPAPALAVYSRPYHGQQDLYALDLASGKEHRILGVSSRGADETLPSISGGHLAFVRPNGPRPGVWTWNGRRSANRVSPVVAIQTAINISRVAYATPTAVVVRKQAGDGGMSILRARTRPRSLVLSLYRASWLERDGVVAQSARVSVAAGTTTVRRTRRPLPPATQSIAIEDRDVSLRLGPDGLQRISPRLEFAAG